MTRLSYRCGTAATPLVYETIGRLFDRKAEAYPERDALVVRHQGIHWSYAQYREQVDKLATGLLNLGIRKGDRVGIWAPNCAEWCLTQMATAKIGAILVCINPAYRVHELEYALNAVECRAIVTAAQFKTSDYLAMLAELAPELATAAPGELHAQRLPHLRWVIRMGADASPGMLNFDQVCEQGTEGDYQTLASIGAQLDPDEPINIQFTSGTTGNPKGATLTHFNILNNGNQVGEG